MNPYPPMPTIQTTEEIQSGFAPSASIPIPIRLKTSQYRNVSWHNQTRMWQAYVFDPSSKKRKHLGFFKEEKQAAIAFDKAYRKLNNKESSPNFGDQPL